MEFTTILILMGLILAFLIDAYIATLMQKVGVDKGYGEEHHIWAICFWLGIIGYLYVIALPDKIQQSQKQKLIIQNQKLIDLLEEQK